jgi:RND family efflux transporter MFP subunit
MLPVRVGRGKTWGVTALLAVTLIGAGVGLRVWVFTDEQAGSADGSGPVPVEVALVEHGPIERRREFTGSLEASAEFTVAAKVGGRVARITVDLADPVTRGQVVVELDDDELHQAEAQARADLAVATAQAGAADKALEIASRNHARASDLRKRGFASDQELDTARAEKLTAEATVEVARAELTRARAAHKAAQIRQSYAKVTADWSEGDEPRVVAARFVDEGSMVSASAPLLTIVELDPVIAVVFVTEADYAQLAPGMPITLRTDAFPHESFAGSISRIAPVFRVESRQARVEMVVQNPDARLKPGMFVRTQAVLERIEDATLVPEAALVERAGETVVFVADETSAIVRMRAVEVGVQQGDRVAVTGKDGQPITGRVVSLGQQQLVDGSTIVVPERRPVDEGGP